MALSGTWAYTVTRDLIIRQAMLNVGALGEAEVATAQEVSDCADKLNMLVKQWMGYQDFAPGLKMWERQRASLFLSSTQGIYQLGPSSPDNWAAGVATNPLATYQQQQTLAVTGGGSNVLSFASASQITVGDFLVIQVSSGDIFSTTAASVGSTVVNTASPIPTAVNVNQGAYVWNYTTKGQRPLAIRTCILRDITKADTPLNPFTLEDYEMLPTKVQPGFISDPASYYYESQLTNGKLYLDVAGEQDVTKHLHIVYMRPVMDFNNPNDNPEYPQQWYRALCWGLSKDIAPMFDAEWTQDMEQTLKDALGMSREADAEVSSFYFQPNAGSMFDP